jgi:hypothetical protein
VAVFAVRVFGILVLHAHGNGNSTVKSEECELNGHLFLDGCFSRPIDRSIVSASLAKAAARSGVEASAREW